MSHQLRCWLTGPLFSGDRRGRSPVQSERSGADVLETAGVCSSSLSTASRGDRRSSFQVLVHVSSTICVCEKHSCVTRVCSCWVSDRADTVPGYDFLVNSVWPEMIRAIEERLSYLFNPGNPDVFYAVRGRLRPDSDSPLQLSRSFTCRSFAEVQREHGVRTQV